MLSCLVLVQILKHFLAYILSQTSAFQIDNPDSKKVAEVDSAAGEKWRALSEEEKKGYEEASEKAKVQADRTAAFKQYISSHVCTVPSTHQHAQAALPVIGLVMSGS